MNQFQGSFFIPHGCGCSWTSRALCIRHTRAAIFKRFNPFIDDSTRENLFPILSTHVEMNLCSRHTLCPQKAYDWTLFLFGAIYKFRSHLHHSVTTLILNCKVSRLAGLTSHMTLSGMTNYYSSRPHSFPRKYKSVETFWIVLVNTFDMTDLVSHILDQLVFISIKSNWLLYWLLLIWISSYQLLLVVGAWVWYHRSIMVGQQFAFSVVPMGWDWRNGWALSI